MMNSDPTIPECPQVPEPLPGPPSRLSRLSGFLWAIVGVALVFRLLLLPYGLPLLLYEDEPIYYQHALGFGLGQWDIGYFKKPAFFLYFYGLFYALGFLYSPFMTWQAYVDAFWENPTYVAVIGRFLSICFAIGSVYLTGRLGQRAFGWSVGLAAAFLMAIDYTHVRISPIVIADIPSLFFILATAWFALRIAEDGRFRDYLACALCVALAVSFKYNAFSLAFLLAGHWSYCRKQTNPDEGLLPVVKSAVFNRTLWLSVGLIPLAFLLLNPIIIKDFSTFLADLQHEKQHMLVRDPSDTTAQWQPMAAFNMIFFKILPRSMGWPLFILGVLGALWGIWKAKRTLLVLLSFPVLFLLVVLQFQLINAKYLLPLHPFWYILAAMFLWEVIDALAARWPRWWTDVRRQAIFGALLVLAAMPNMVSTLSYMAVQAKPDTRDSALSEVQLLARDKDWLLLEPDTLTLNNRIIRSQTITAQLQAHHFHTQGHSAHALASQNLAKSLQPRFVLVNLGQAKKSKRSKEGEVTYYLPYLPEYYDTLRQHYRIKQLIAPYEVLVSDNLLQAELKQNGFGDLYRLIQENKTARQHPGPTLLLMERVAVAEEPQK